MCIGPARRRRFAKYSHLLDTARERHGASHRRASAHNQNRSTNERERAVPPAGRCAARAVGDAMPPLLSPRYEERIAGYLWGRRCVDTLDPCREADFHSVRPAGSVRETRHFEPRSGPRTCAVQHCSGRRASDRNRYRRAPERAHAVSDERCESLLGPFSFRVAAAAQGSRGSGTHASRLSRAAHRGHRRDGAERRRAASAWRRSGRIDRGAHDRWAPQAGR